MSERHAEIAGGGFAGLALAIGLRQRGWSVRVHERRSLIKAEGFGISVHRNGVRVLEALGALPEVQENSMKVVRLDRYDARHRKVASVRPEHSLRTSRHFLITALHRQAIRLGVVVEIDSPVEGATEDGRLVLADGRTLRADLVAGCDGYNSKVRDSLGLLESRKLLPDCGLRIMVPIADDAPRFDPEVGVASSEHWSGTRRILITPCNPDEIYVGMSCLKADAQANRIPIDPLVWKASFPALGDLIDRAVRFADWEHAQFAQFQVLKLTKWSKGRVAIVGDAANAMPPNLGQGTGIAMMNALALAVTLDEVPDVAEALALWEERERPLTEHTQKWSLMYSATTHWPDYLRSLAMAATGRIPALRERYQRTANSVPRGWSA